MSQDLFRPAVIDSHSKLYFGSILIARPISFAVLAGLSACLLLALILGLALCHYTRRSSVQGVLEPVGGVVKLYAPQAGVLSELRVSEGDYVREGQVLLVFRSEHQSTKGTAIESEEGEQLRARLGTLQRELSGTAQLQDFDAQATRQRIVAMHELALNLAMQIKTQARRVESAHAQVERFAELQASGFVSITQVQEKKDDESDQQMRLASLQKDSITNNADLAQLEADLRSASTKRQVATGPLERSISSIMTDLAQQDATHTWSIVAPSAGIVGSLAINRNQSANTTSPLLTIVPRDGELQARLYVPSHAVGFMTPGQTAAVKLDAFPYQKFGLLGAKISAVATSPAMPAELSNGTRLGIAAAQDNAEPLYGVSLKLERQFVEAYGQKIVLRPGLQLVAEVDLDRRTLLEWLVEPLLGMASR
jgi:membrane fusion protein